MPAAILNQGITSIRDAVKSAFINLACSDDNTPFLATHTGINPAGAATSTIVKTATITNIDASTFEATITIFGNTEFTNKQIFAIGGSKGLGIRQAAGSGGAHTGGGTVGNDQTTRTVRTFYIGVEAGDIFTVGIRVKGQDNS
jgi:hypothetical protein